MSESSIAISVFILILTVTALVLTVKGRLSFWKLVQRHPDIAMEWFSSRSEWQILYEKGESPSPNLVGPFYFKDPYSGAFLRLYTEEGQLEASQKEFIQQYHGLVPSYMLPWFSLIALAYPIWAMKSFEGTETSAFLILGYGFANLGYLLGVATIFPGTFRILGLESRPQVLVAGVLAFIFGAIIVNI